MSLEDLHDWWQPAAFGAAAVLVALLAYRLLRPLALRLTRHSTTLHAIVMRLDGSLYWVLPLVALQLVWQGTPEALPGLAAIGHLNGVLLIAALTATAIAAVRGMADAVALTHPQDVADNLEARRIITQTRVLSQLEGQLAILLGGRVGEELVFGDISSGAQNDLEHASKIARAMVTQLGMSRSLGPVTYGERATLSLLGVAGQEERNYSEHTARPIDTEVCSLVDTAQKRAREILSAKRPALEALAAALQEREVMDQKEVEQLVRQRSRRPAGVDRQSIGDKEEAGIEDLQP